MMNERIVTRARLRATCSTARLMFTERQHMGSRIEHKLIVNDGKASLALVYRCCGVFFSLEVNRHLFDDFQWTQLNLSINSNIASLS